MADWRWFSFWGSLRDGDPYAVDAAFHAGHLNDALRMNSAPFFPLLVASDTSGVWIVNEFGGFALPLSWSWDFSPHLNCLCPGIHTVEHVYAAGDFLWETDTTTTAPLLNWRRIPIQTDGEHPLNAGEIHRVTVVRERGKIVVAADFGIFWANIPPPGGNYSFKKALSLPDFRYSGLSEGLKNTVVVGAWGSDLSSHFGIFVGDWTGAAGDLKFDRASILGDINARRMFRTEIASCAQDRSRLYAVCGGGGGGGVLFDSSGNIQKDDFGNAKFGGDDLIYRVLASRDGGSSWQVTGNAIPGSANVLFNGSPDVIGHTQWGYNLCIAVSPFDANLIAVGVGTVAVSQKGGNDDWQLLTNSPHLHADVHGLLFDQTDPARRRLYICSDGGLASTPDLGASFATGANRLLPNFQFSRFAASPLNPGLVAGSLQDNGNVYTEQYVNVDPWKDLDGGDGVLTMFLQSGHLVRSNNTLTMNDASGSSVEYGNKARVAAWDDGKRVFTDLKLFPNDPLSFGVIPVDNTNDGLRFDVVDDVDEPAWVNALGQPMLAVAEVTETVYGLFNDGTGHFVWNQLATMPHEPDKDAAGKEKPYYATAIASFDGNAILVGTNNGKAFRFDAPAWTVTEISIPGVVEPMAGFAPLAPSPIFAISGKQIFRYDGKGWTDITAALLPIPTSLLTVVRADHSDPTQIYLASNSQVWNSTDSGATWNDFTGLLPHVAQIRDMRFVTESSGASFLYLATYGWSAFRRLLNFNEVVKTITVDGHMDIVDRVAFGHDLWAHPGIFNILQLGPLHPIEEADYNVTDGDEIRVTLKLRFEWHTDFSVVVRYDAELIAMDEDDYVDDSASGNFTVPFGTKKQWIIDLASDELWPDRAHIEINVGNP